MTATIKPITTPTGFRPVLVNMADVKPEPVTWIWPGRVAAGKLTVLAGDPGLGKSWITLDIASRISADKPWPDTENTSPLSDVVLLSAEDGLADTIRPRLDALGADVKRVHHLAVLRQGTVERAVQLADTKALEQAIRETNAKIMIIDPLSAYMGSTDSHRDAEVRSLIAPMAAVAERTGAAIIGVMHFSKSAQRPAIYRAIGSIAFAAAARIVLAVAADPDQEGRRIMAPVKNNLASPAPALAFTLADGRLNWSSDPVSDVDVDTLLAGPTMNDHEHREVDTWLRQLLQAGEMPSKRIEKEADEAGFARRTLFRAKARLHIDAVRIGGESRGSGAWYWRLPLKGASIAGAD